MLAVAVNYWKNTKIDINVLILTFRQDKTIAHGLM